VIEGLRNRQVKNFLAVTLLALGTPMLLMGDEVRRTQRGNNNAYCQDNEISWFDWTLLQKHKDVHRFVQKLIAARLQRDLAVTESAWTLSELLRLVSIEWHGVRLHQPDWGEHSHSIAMTIRSITERLFIHLMMNAYWEPLKFEVPDAPASMPEGWRRWIDTSLTSPDDICDWGKGRGVQDRRYVVQPRCVVALVSGSFGGLR
jgi:isoamylase